MWFPSKRWLGQQCPIITKLIKNIGPKLKTALISKLGPQINLKPHQGWADLSNNILRCHYGINVPEKCGLIVNNEIKEMNEERWLIFDDSHEHSAYNMSNQNRYVLIIDLERPNDIPKGISDIKVTDELALLIEKYSSHKNQ